MATVCLQVHNMYWGIWVSFIESYLIQIDTKQSVWEIYPAHLFGSKLTYMFSMYLKSGDHRHFNWRFITALHRTPWFLCLYISTMNRISGGNMQKYGYLRCSHAREREIYPCFILSAIHTFVIPYHIRNIMLYTSVFKTRGHPSGPICSIQVLSCLVLIYHVWPT